MPLTKLFTSISRTLAWRGLPASRRPLSSSNALAAKQMPPRPTIDESEITGTYLKGSGPGGQKIPPSLRVTHPPPFQTHPPKAKTEYIPVQLIHLPTNTVVKSQATRSRSQNRKIALQILAEKVELLQKGDESRAAIVAETKRKRKASMTKKSKRKYRALEEKKRREMEEAEIAREGEEEGRGEEADELPRR
uniref:Peptidyl-tRNA hydrolase domain-containing protein n=1 Tax=Coccidioides posadasii RMSCC 3488 TaxID=454284 RepID=A0A0J6FQY8_COCPO|nr:peptidyl-tRNA hydrolase domain-containing protein [Coccidioides posadasii RMSCC 3488]